MRRFVRGLAELDADSVALVGGKGANLAELVAVGVPVPPAFCVTTDAYRVFLDHGGLTSRIAAAVDRIDFGDPAGIELHASTIRASFLDAPIPSEVADEIVAAHGQLADRLGGQVSVAVRSSATAEDLPGASFAGQQDTYLHVFGPDGVVEAARRCWASLWTGRAIAYRQAQGFAQDTVWLAVVVQAMFPSSVAGVLFTANPLTSNPFQFFLNVSYGLGEAIVSGHVNPDQLIVAKQPLAIVDRRISDKTVMTVPDASGGTVEVPVPTDRRKVQALDDATVHELCTLGQQIEDHFGFPQDIEWGWADGRFAILQSREITGADLDVGHALETWKTPRALASMYEPRWTWSRAYSDEVQTGPTTPSFYTRLQRSMTSLKATALTLTGTADVLGYDRSEFLDLPYFRWFGARAYYNLAFERERIRRFIPPVARTPAALLPFPAHEREEIASLPFDWDHLLGLLRELHKSNPEVSLLGTTAVMYEGLARWTEQDDAFWRTFDLEAATVPEILRAQTTPHSESKFVPNVVLPFTIYLYVLPPALEALCKAWLDDEDGTIYDRLLGGLQTKTAEENVAVWRLSRSIAGSPALAELVRTTPDEQVLDAVAGHADGRTFLAQLDAFLVTHGHRGGSERDSYHRRWRDHPAQVLASVRPMLALDEDQSPERHEHRQRQQMVETRAACVAELRSTPPALGEFWWVGELNRLADRPATTRAELFEWFVDLVRDYFYYRDFERFYNDKSMGRYRSHYEAIGRKLLQRRLLDDEDDVFFLGREEMLAADGGNLSSRHVAARVRARRRVYEKYARREPPKYLRGWETFDDEVIAEDGALIGIGASSGVVTGTARVCRDLADVARLAPGDILVTVATDPAWTTVFSIVGGVVVETGGVVAHAVMISREYGLPCVANLSRACDEIPDGSVITVDGTRGRVLIEA